MVSWEPVKQTKLLSEKSYGKRESEGNKALRIPQKLVFIFHSPILPSPNSTSHHVFFPARVWKKKTNKQTKKKNDKKQQQQQHEMNPGLRSTKAYVLLI